MKKEEVDEFNAFIDVGFNMDRESFFITHLVRLDDQPGYSLRVGKYVWKGRPYDSLIDWDAVIYFYFVIPETTSAATLPTNLNWLQRLLFVFGVSYRP